jgi:hypothetical protein
VNPSTVIPGRLARAEPDPEGREGVEIHKQEIDHSSVTAVPLTDTIIMPSFLPSAP